MVSFFIYSFFCVQPFDRKLRSSLICLFYFYTTIRQKLGVILTLFFFLIVSKFCSLALFMAILLLYFVGYIYGYMNPSPGIQTERKTNLGWWKIRSNEKHRISILSRDLNYARYNLCSFIKDGFDYSEIIQIFLLCFIFMCL